MKRYNKLLLCLLLVCALLPLPALLPEGAAHADVVNEIASSTAVSLFIAPSSQVQRCEVSREICRLT